jgi:hypothetical protein
MRVKIAKRCIELLNEIKIKHLDNKTCRNVDFIIASLEMEISKNKFRGMAIKRGLK